MLASVHQFVDGQQGRHKGSWRFVPIKHPSPQSPPYEWPYGACAKWVSDFDADARKKHHGWSCHASTRGTWTSPRTALRGHSRQLASRAGSQSAKSAHHHAHHKEPIRLANHRMVMGKTLGIGGQSPDSQMRRSGSGCIVGVPGHPGGREGITTEPVGGPRAGRAKGLKGRVKGTGLRTANGTDAPYCGPVSEPHRCTPHHSAPLH